MDALGFKRRGPDPRMSALLVCSLFALNAAGARADGTYVKEGGGGIIALHNKDVRMVWETLDIAVDRKDLLAPDSQLTVTATYLFRNESKQPLAIEMGFPVAWDQSEFYAQAAHCFDRDSHSSVSEFSVTVDGQVMSAILREGKKPIKTGCLKDEAANRAREREAKANEKGPFYHQFYVWPIAFAPGADHTVINHYRYDAKVTGYWEENDLVYILKTGGLWRGSIDKLSIRFHLGDRGCVYEGGPESCIAGVGDELHDFTDDPFKLSREVPEKITPAGGKLHRLPDGTDELLWALSGYKPESDVRLAYQTALAARNAVRKSIEKLDLRNTNARRLAWARDTLLALYGLTFTDPITQKRYAQKSWYVIDPTMTRERAATDKLLVNVEASLAAAPH